MSNRWVCRYCILTRGLKGSDLKDWPALDDQEAQFRHIESEHHIPVRRKGETEQGCLDRFRRENPEAEDPATCRCPECSAARERNQEPDA